MQAIVKNFYDDFCHNCCIDNTGSKYIENLKHTFFENKLNNNKIYKFIAFDENKELNCQKLESLNNRQLWFGAHYTFEDDTELKIKINPYKVSRFTKKTIPFINFLIDTFREMNDICCLTTSIRENMWEKYANNYNGVCLEFFIQSYEFLMPIIYTNKSTIDYSKNCINFINSNGEDLTKPDYNRNVLVFESCVLKDKTKYEFEDEVRLLCGDVYDKTDDELGGAICAGKKKLLGYKGKNYTYNYVGLELCGISYGKNLDNEIKKTIEQIMAKQKI